MLIAMDCHTTLPLRLKDQEVPEKYEPYFEILSYIDSSGLSAKPWPNVPLHHNWSMKSPTTALHVIR